MFSEICSKKLLKKERKLPKSIDKKFSVKFSMCSANKALVLNYLKINQNVSAYVHRLLEKKLKT